MCNTDLGTHLGPVHRNIGFVKKLTYIKYLSRVNILTNPILCVLIFFLPKKKKIQREPLVIIFEYRLVV